ncbi:hypothetical protein [Azonexus hydrophilus]|uniref:Uncharacterized protein n=1 Tax=Azonexus hydrophilus TaxID=418702 RepID=A0ABZ2XPT3_9RHOO
MKNTVLLIALTALLVSGIAIIATYASGHVEMAAAAGEFWLGAVVAAAGAGIFFSGRPASANKLARFSY